MVQQQTAAASAVLERPAIPSTDAGETQVPALDPALAAGLELARSPTSELSAWVERSKNALGGFFAKFSLEQLAMVLAGGQLHHFEPGGTVIEVGDTKDSLFVLLAEGKVRVVTPINLPPPVGNWLSGEKSLVELPAPIVMGEMNLLAATTRSATVEALTELDAVEVERTYLDKLAEHDPRLGYLLMRSVGNVLQFRLRQMNTDVTNLTVAVALAARALKK